MLLEFRLAKALKIRDGNPVIARHVRRGNDADNLHQFVEFFRSTFESHQAGAIARLEISDAIHFFTDTKEQIVLPADFLGGVRERQAEFAHPV